LGTAVIPLGAAFLYRFSGSDGNRSFKPYIGVGLDGYFGYERTSVTISRAPEGEYDWNDTQFRYTWGGNAFIGADIKLTEKVYGLVEIRWTQGVDGSDVEQSFSQEEINDGWLEADKAVQRPNFNFTGWSVSIGAGW
jgi:outer membrane protein W